MPDPAAGLTRYAYTEQGSTYLFWAETPDTVKMRIRIAKKDDLAGIAAWRLGYESADLRMHIMRSK